MANVTLAALIDALDATCKEGLEAAALACAGRGAYEITIDEYLRALLPLQPFQDILAQFERSNDRMQELLDKSRMPEGRNSGRPVFSPLLIQFLQEAYLLCSLELGLSKISVDILVLALLSNPNRYGVMPFFVELKEIPADELRKLIEGNNAGNKSASRQSQSGEGGDVIARYCTDFTEEARKGKVDPVFARGPEIRLMIDILTRRRKNNPILVGDPGVGKTAVVEGLALKVIEGSVPNALRGVRIVGLDMGRLQAGASVKGEFEKRLKGVIDTVKAAPVPTILFIDEAHTLVGSGNAAGSGDGANLLKPALARGELRTIAATTWSEYKKYFEKDAALARRFQLVKLDEPSVEETVTILRGIVPGYEKAHHVYIRDDAVTRTAELAARYISGRQLPDKAIDVLDTACARVRVSLGAKPSILENAEEELAGIRRELDAMERDSAKGVRSGSARDSERRHAALKGRFAELFAFCDEIEARWKAEQSLVERILRLRTGSPATPPAPSAPTTGAASADAASDAAPAVTDAPEDATAGKSAEGEGTAPEAAATAPTAASASTAPVQEKSVEELIEELHALQGDAPLVFFEVSPRLVTGIVSEWTGIPEGKLGGADAGSLSSLGQRLRTRIYGQDFALDAIEKAVIAAQAGLDSPTRPTGIFLLVGPSGVGKTETALAVSDELFGGERMLISINMSEFQEKHTVSRLIGSPPGYVGYGEGGRLTEAVRRQPYSAVLFDEVEKAHPDILNLFYQVFDKGILADGEGREVDFRNTMIFMTSNLGGDIISALCEGDVSPDPEELLEALRPALTQFFRPALLGRMTIVPYAAIRPTILRQLVELKLSQVGERMRQRHSIPLTWEQAVVDNITSSCTAVDTGARNIDHIINASLLPGMANVLLGTLADSSRRERALHLGIEAEEGKFTYDLKEL